MMQTSEAFELPAPPPPGSHKAGWKVPSCCHQEMLILLRRAVLHSDGSVDYQIAWGCSHCGRRIL